MREDKRRPVRVRADLYEQIEKLTVEIIQTRGIYFEKAEILDEVMKAGIELLEKEILEKPPANTDRG
jgi:hypothetical protein